MERNSRTIIVSNRLPVTLIRTQDGKVETQRSNGGLVSGLAGLHKMKDTLWLGYAGLSPKDADYKGAKHLLHKQRYIPVDVSDADYGSFYNGACNGSIWPLFHYAPHFMTRTEGDWQAYVKVNHLFAAEILNIAKAGDYVWIHDYHLMLVPEILREEMPDLRIAYFHHIPFPAHEMFRIHPKRESILRGLLGADLIGMHTIDYALNFQSAVTRLLEARVETDSIFFRDHRAKVGAFPLGVDVQNIRRTLNAAPKCELLTQLEGKKVLLGIDRLDYTKGLPEKLTAFRLLLTNHPEYIGHIVLLQVCVPTRMEVPNYAELRAEIERLVGQINGEFGHPGYVPLQYLFQPFSPEQVYQFYEHADVALVTPLRDGLNLVSKEYVASRRDDDGVLILSELAGSAAEMGEALLVNPYDVRALAEAIHSALSMPNLERRHRMRRLRERVQRSDNLSWATTFKLAWQEASSSKTKKRSVGLTGISVPLLIETILSYRIKSLFLDYDGTLVPIVASPDLAVPSKATLHLLHMLSRIPDFEVAIITGRSQEFCLQHLGDLPITLASEHSAFVRIRGDRHFVATFNLEELEHFKEVARPYLARYLARVPGSQLEEKVTSLVVHYRQSEPSFAHGQALDLRENLSQILANSPFGVYLAKKAIEVKPRSANKGLAIERCLASWQDDDEAFLTAGDDATDEDMFRVRSAVNHSIYVGYPTTTAKYHVASPVELADFLQKLALAAQVRKNQKSRLPPHQHL